MKNADAPADTVMMSVMHDALRRDFARVREVLHAPDLPAPPQARALASHLLFMLVFLEGHHHSEDEKLWPLVLAHDPALGPLMDAMSRDHAAVAAEVDRLERAARQFGQEPDQVTRTDLVVAIERLNAVLGPHLDREENELMPRVSACLTTAQWRQFEKSAKPDMSIPMLAEYLNWFLEDLDPVRRHKVVTSMPAPIVLISTRVFGPGYRRRATKRWGEGSNARGRRRGVVSKKAFPLSTVKQRAMRAANTVAVSLYRRTGGRIGGRAKGVDVLLLTVAGRKTGKPHTVPVAYLEHGTEYVVTGSGGGMRDEPQWFRNLRGTDTAEVEIGRLRNAVVSRVAEGAEREELWQEVALARAPFFAKYQEKAGREIPIAILTPSP